MVCKAVDESSGILHITTQPSDPELWTQNISINPHTHTHTHTYHCVTLTLHNIKYHKKHWRQNLLVTAVTHTLTHWHCHTGHLSSTHTHPGCCDSHVMSPVTVAKSLCLSIFHVFCFVEGFVKAAVVAARHHTGSQITGPTQPRTPTDNRENTARVRNWVVYKQYTWYSLASISLYNILQFNRLLLFDMVYYRVTQPGYTYRYQSAGI